MCISNIFLHKLRKTTKISVTTAGLRLWKREFPKGTGYNLWGSGRGLISCAFPTFSFTNWGKLRKYQSRQLASGFENGNFRIQSCVLPNPLRYSRVITFKQTDMKKVCGSILENFLFESFKAKKNPHRRSELIQNRLSVSSPQRQPEFFFSHPRSPSFAATIHKN
jgi:hypothetical protein